VLGPSVSGVLVATVGPGWALGVDSGTFLASAAFLVGLELATAIPPAPRQRFLAELGAGWQEVRSRTWVWVDGLFSALGNAIILAPFFVLGPVVAKRSLHGPASWAAIVAAFGVGSVLGSFVALRLKPRRPLLVGWTALLAFALPSALLAVPTSTAAVAAAAFLAGLSLDPREPVLRDDAPAVRSGGRPLARDVLRLAPGARASARRVRARRPRVWGDRPPRDARRRRGLGGSPERRRDLDPEHQAPRAARRRAARSQLRRMRPLHGRTSAQ
jgi:MFS family permease